MRHLVLAAAAALALVACNQQGNGPPLPPVQQGAQAPSTQTPVSGVRQGQPTPEIREQIIARIGQYLDGYQGQFAASLTQVQGQGDQIVPIQPGTDTRWLVELTGGTAYTFLGACDDDCNNVDLELIDTRTGGVVASDMLPDDYPVVNFTPPQDGRYIARLLLQTCTVAPCYTGTRMLTAGAAASAPK